MKLNFQMLEEVFIHLAVKATNRFEETRDKVKNYINANIEKKLYLQKVQQKPSILVASSFGEKFINKGDEILTTELEHHSNYVPWHFLRKKKVQLLNLHQ